MTRKQALAVIKAAAAKGDMDTATRIYCENRISRRVYEEAVEQGRNLAKALAGRTA
jgi:hypothetical protein